MLERQGLVVGPWAAVPDLREGRPRRRAVLDAATGEPLGFVARAAPGTLWLRWLRPAVLEVYETEDASLVCTLRGPSLGRRTWEVRDSEGRRVATLFQAVVRDAEGRRQATLQRSARGGTFYNQAGLALAAFTPCERGTVLTFAAALEGNPFARMALLGATLAASE
jgi:hypothetical protein